MQSSTKKSTEKPTFLQFLEKYEPILPWVTATISVLSFFITVSLLKKKT